MKRRNLPAIAMLSLGLIFGVIVGRWFMPDRYGLVTMALLVLGGLVTGALLMRAAMAARSREPESNVTAQPYAWQLHLGEKRFVVRYDAAWWERTRANLAGRANGTLANASAVRLATATLFGAVILALYGQYAFSTEKGWVLGLYAYLFAIVCFVLLLLLVDQPDAAEASIPQATDTPLQSRWRMAMIVLATLGAILVTMVGPTTPWNVPQTENIVLWLGVSVLYAAAFLPWSHFARWLRTRDLSWIRVLGQRVWQRRSELILLAGIMAVAFVARYWRLAWIPGIFGGDEGEMGNEALAVLNGVTKNPFITGWLSHATLFFFLQSISLRLLGATVYGLRFVAVVGGTLSVFVSYLLIRRLFNVRLALLTAALLAAFNFHIHFSRLAVNNIYDSVFAPLVLLLFYAGLESRRAAYFALAGMAMGLAIYFYHGTRLIPVIVAVFILYLLVTQRELIFKNAVNFVWMALGAFIVAGPLLYFFYLHPNDFMARLNQRGLFQSGTFDALLKSGKSAAQIMADQLRGSFLAFNLVPDRMVWFGTGAPLLDPLAGMFFVFGAVYSGVQFRKKNYALLLLWLVLGIFLGSTLLENPPTSPTFVMVSVPAIFFVALGLDKLLELASRVLRPLARVRWQAAALVALFIAAWGLTFYFVEYTPRYAYGGDANWVAQELVKYLQPRRDKYRVYFVAPPVMYLGIGSRKFLMPQVNGEDVMNPIQSAADLDFVKPSRPALFVFIPARAGEMPIVEQTFPGGVVHNFNKPDGKPLFFIYEVNTP